MNKTQLSLAFAITSLKMGKTVTWCAPTFTSAADVVAEVASRCTPAEWAGFSVIVL